MQEMIGPMQKALANNAVVVTQWHGIHPANGSSRVHAALSFSAFIDYRTLIIIRPLSIDHD